jgi:hypothetical protein
MDKGEGVFKGDQLVVRVSNGLRRGGWRSGNIVVYPIQTSNSHRLA